MMYVCVCVCVCVLNINLGADVSGLASIWHRNSIIFDTRKNPLLNS